ncbi:hypothetical protein PXD04_02460 [Methanosphaera sp. ISO3-F5]|uniref:hypothetical protein n=1 Tax=Methanosphaera sp. ISO3-F5 TaxID=1452353 RepID=UPI002B25ACD7|nr:hypothetical protein [Methanosphaera sp. ISO3-F5]WQH64678.1 hypothetical protein PXD04_02460 [Methanosphaera sp. ISO3-F5]
MVVDCLNFNVDENFNVIKTFVIDNKDEYKNDFLPNGLKIKGIGEKFLKIENNFVSWDSLCSAREEYLKGEPVDNFISSILSWIFSDVNVSDYYIPHKFGLNENFSSVKNEILSHKAFYKKDLISGIGDNNIKITTSKGKDYYIEWDELENVVENVKFSGFDDLEAKRFSSSLVRQLFNDNLPEYSPYEEELLGEEYGKIKLKFYKICCRGLLSYKLIRDEIEDKKVRCAIVESALEWNKGQLPLSINEEGINHVILSKSSLVRADLRVNAHFTKVLDDELGLDLKVYSTEYGDEYVYHVHEYRKLIKFERDCSKWVVTYSNKNLLQNAFRKRISSYWVCSVSTSKSTEVCTVLDYDNQNNVFDPDLFVKFYNEFHR